MFTQSLKMEIRGANDRVYSLHLSSESPLGELYEAINTMRNVVWKQMEDQREKEMTKDSEPKECSDEDEKEHVFHR